METYINSVNKWEKRKEKRASRSKGIKENWCCRPAAACNETGCKSAWLPAWLLGLLCVGGTFLLLIVVPLYFSSHLCHFSFSSNHSLPIINVHIFCPHWSAIVAIYLRQLHKQIVDYTHLWRAALLPLAKWLGFNSLWSANFLLSCCCAPLPLMMHSHIQLPGSVRWLMDGWTFWDVMIMRA